MPQHEEGAPSDALLTSARWQRNGVLPACARCLLVFASLYACELAQIVDMSLQDQACVRGDSCPYAHNVFEYWLHPTRYRTQLCNDMEKCNRKVSASSSPLLFAILASFLAVHQAWDG